ncbi:MAG: prephenate dehydrogenase/arogenate dehydrogenase family protein [Parvularculaceae bacterium]
MADKPAFNRAVIVGVGLIGSSLALAMRANGLAASIVGVDRSADVIARAKKLGVIDSGETDLAKGVKGADLIVLSTPVGAIAEVAKALAADADDGALVIDVGSVKGVVAEAAKALPERVLFVPCHPVAGTEQSGPEAGFATLFHDRWCILTPLAREDVAYKSAVERAAALWTGVGAKVEIMTAEHHDLALAVTSHPPYLIAFTIVGAADDVESVAAVRSSNIPPAVSATSRASPPPIRSCGATSSSTTRKRCWKFWGAFRKNSR